MSDETDSDAPTPVVLTKPRDGVPDVICDDQALNRVIDSLNAGYGPVAIDAERASGFRYHPRAYLIQLRRAKAGTFLIDPTGFDDLRPLNDALTDTEWILHAASQDLACLHGESLQPQRLFDTELAARLCGYERVGLAALVDKLLGFTLEKHHSAADWSTRPLPADWLTYAALDVELLIELRDTLDAELTLQGKREWADEEFAATMAAGPPAPRAEPWRRTSGIHRVRGPRALARVRELWLVRDDIAQRLDKAPSKIVPDPALSDAAIADPTDFGELTSIPGFQRRHGRGNAKRWLQALSKARKLADDQLPSVSPPSDSPPPTNRWAARDPAAASRLKRARAAVAKIAEIHTLPPENLIAPAAVRSLCWQPPRHINDSTVTAALTRSGVRPWQIVMVSKALAAAVRK